MFGSNDDKKAPAESGEKKGLFGWFRKKPQQPAAEQPATPPEPVEAPLAPSPTADVEAPAVQEVVEVPLAPSPAPIAVEEVRHEALGPQPSVTEAPVSNLVLPVAEEPVALVPDLEPSAPPPIPERPVLDPEPVAAVVQPVVAEPQPEPEPVIRQPEVAPVVAAVPATPVPAVLEPEPEPTVAAPAPALEQNRPGFFARLKQGLSKTSASIGEGMASLFLGRKVIDDDLLDEIETRLLTADVGVEATTLIVQNLTQKVARKQLADADALYKSLQDELAALLRPVEQPLKIESQGKPYVILVVGVNGAGKTTTIGKLAKKLQLEGKKVMLAAGDTFRAAAVEQLQVWGERNQIPVIAQHTGADSASVIFDAVQAAKARGADVLIADTAGRLHTKDNLMEELKKVRRVIGKLDAEAPHEVLLVLDAGTGQNAISQAKYFNQSVELTGLALTKLDGTAKGGVIFALAKQFSLPIRFIGVGEGIDDLRTFEAEPFVKALFAEREHP
ncbi:signal recognition particle-docking protein FtsY [Pseudomonas sp. S75]|uniref:signal recognition particle-docking protein FtsY n=1 Tax=unclassified Pseudomonas TaxID=196821 RepID=UPI001904C216|nr:MULTISPECIES: signal recognition particle-docking protein FtsY [unclassified Pseudomonas]MBJ9977979.1 signal recognition particle-docking protein FtsY [Pseudomonas sp. S30]MBK0155731.1 signal recognition particle-docking protein FtsY [Pseudomonas sp. S75]